MEKIEAVAADWISQIDKVGEIVVILLSYHGIKQSAP